MHSLVSNNKWVLKNQKFLRHSSIFFPNCSPLNSVYCDRSNLFLYRINSFLNTSLNYSIYSYIVMRIVDKKNWKYTENKEKEKKAALVNLKEDCNCVAHHFCFSLSYTTVTPSGHFISYSWFTFNLICLSKIKVGFHSSWFRRKFSR